MMDQEKWDKLFKAFDDEEPWWEGNVYVDCNEIDLDLMSWLECDSTGPSYEMKRAFGLHGYDVFPVERDSFGWLIGGVRRMLTPEKKVITFG